MLTKQKAIELLQQILALPGTEEEKMIAGVELMRNAGVCNPEIKGYYEDERYCPFCDRDTKQKCKDSDHERDSSGDYAECLICGAVYTGYSGRYEQG